MWLSTTMRLCASSADSCNNHSKCGFLQLLQWQHLSNLVVITTQNVAFYNYDFDEKTFVFVVITTQNVAFYNSHRNQFAP